MIHEMTENTDFKYFFAILLDDVEAKEQLLDWDGARVRGDCACSTRSFRAAYMRIFDEALIDAQRGKFPTYMFGIVRPAKEQRQQSLSPGEETRAPCFDPPGHTGTFPAFVPLFPYWNEAKSPQCLGYGKRDGSCIIHTDEL